MSVPPPGGWQPGPIPPNQGQPYGQPFDPSAYNPQQQPPPPGWQQGSWGQQPGPPPPSKGGGLKWLLIAVAVLLVVAVSIGATLLFTRDSGGGGSTPTSGAPSDIASANDTGPVSIITEEPTCTAFFTINNTLADAQSTGWGDQRATLGPASEWTADQRSLVQNAATAIRNAADQMANLAKRTPHRVIRELYNQFIAYGRAYADKVSSYTPSDDALASANVGINTTLFGICNSIESGAAIRANAAPGTEPKNATEVVTSADPQRFMKSPDQNCNTWQQNSNAFDAGTLAWQQLDPSIAASQWSPERRSLHESALPYWSTWADEMQEIGRRAQNQIFEDFALTASLYAKAYVAVGVNYVGPDSWLSYVTINFNQTILAACRAASG